MNTNLDRLADLAKGIGTGEKPECETCGGLGGLFTGGGTWDGDCHDCEQGVVPEKVPGYGWCPVCGVDDLDALRERAPNGSTTCRNGHREKSSAWLLEAP